MPEHDFPENVDAAFGDASGFALTAAQQGVWIDWSIDPLRTNYNIAEYLEIRGQIDLTIFRAALDRVIAEAEPLHVRFVTEAEELRQMPVHGNDWPFTFVDMTSDPTPRASAEKWLEEYLAVPVDPLSGPLVACALLKVAPDTLFWCARYQHMVNDGFGVAMIARRFAHVYTAMIGGGDPGPSPFGTLAEVIAEDDEYRRSEHFARDRAYWKERLADCPEPVSLSRAQWLRSDRFIRRTAHVPFAKAQQLRQLAKSFGLTLPQLITVSTAIYLNGMTGESDVVLGYTVAGRLGARASRLLSVLSNVAPIRFSIEANTPFAELARRAARNLREAMRRQRYRIADIRRDLGRIDRPLFGPQVNVMAFDYDMTFAGCRVIAHNLANGPVDDLSIAIYDRLIDDDVRIDFDANPLRYTPDEVRAHLDRFIALLSGLVEAEFERDPAKRVGHLSLVTAEEKQLLAKWNATAADTDSDKCLHECIAEQARRTPDAVAVVCEGQQLTYAELDSRANQLAHYLRMFGIGPDMVVGLFFERSLEMVVGLLGILKAGGAYFPLDPAYPADRLAYMLSDADSPVVVTRDALAGRLPPTKAQLVRVDTDSSLISAQPLVAPVVDVGPRNLAYVIYTSGSTGRPKGAMNEHSGVLNCLRSVQPVFQLSARDTVLQKALSTFDVSVMELVWPLMYGARVVLARPEGHKDPAYLVDLICRESITMIHFVPSMLQAFLHSPDVERCVSLKQVICIGEPLTGPLQAEFFKRLGGLGTELHNLYGPTEASIIVTYWQCGPKDVSATAPIGHLISNAQVHILNDALSPVPVGVAGELYIGGIAVGRGYMARPDLTAERFIPDPFVRGDARLYRTGDIARWRADGVLECLGRADHQIKIRGFRVELGEIEAVLKEQRGLRDVAVVALDDGGIEDKRLVAYLVPQESPASQESAKPSSEELRTALARALPDYMVPSAFVFLPKLPLNANGKLDRKALPAPDFESTRAPNAYVAPRSNIELAIAEVWSRVLRVQKPGVHDDFIESGGHSLAAVRLINEINRTLNIKLGIAALFQYRTIEGLAAFAVENVQPVVVQMATGAQATPMYVIYAGYHQFRIARVLGGRRPVFGIDVPYRKSWCAAAAQNRSDGLPELGELVEPYLDALRAHAGGGPCILAGHCFGGLIAFELARRYADTGGTVEAVVLLDSFGFVPNGWRLASQRLRRIWATAGKSTLRDSWRMLRWVAGRLRRVGWTGMRMRLADVVAVDVTGMRDENGGFVNGPTLTRIYNNVFETFERGHASTTGILVRANLTNTVERPYRELDPMLGWSEAFTGGLHVIDSRGSHLSMIEIDENLDAVGRDVNEKLDLVTPDVRNPHADRNLKAAS